MRTFHFIFYVVIRNALDYVHVNGTLYIVHPLKAFAGYSTEYRVLLCAVGIQYITCVSIDMSAY